VAFCENIGGLVMLPNNQRQRRTCYALCHILYPVSAAHMSSFRMDSNTISYGENIRVVAKADDESLDFRVLKPRLFIARSVVTVSGEAGGGFWVNISIHIYMYIYGCGVYM